MLDLDCSHLLLVVAIGIAHAMLATQCNTCSTMRCNRLVTYNYVMYITHCGFQWQLAREAPQFQYFNHLSDCSVQCANRTIETVKQLYIQFSIHYNYMIM